MDKYALRKALDHFKIELSAFLTVYEKYNYSSFSIEYFIFVDEDGFMSESKPKQILKYIKDNNLDIDTTKLETLINHHQELNKIDQQLNDLYSGEYKKMGYSKKEIKKLIREAEETFENLIPSDDWLKKEVFNIRKTIKQLIS